MFTKNDEEITRSESELFIFVQHCIFEAQLGFFIWESSGLLSTLIINIITIINIIIINIIIIIVIFIIVIIIMITIIIIVIC